MRRLALIALPLFALVGCQDGGLPFAQNIGAPFSGETKWTFVSRPGDSFPVALTDPNIQAASSVVCPKGANLNETKPLATDDGTPEARIVTFTCKAP